MLNILVQQPKENFRMLRSYPRNLNVTNCKVAKCGSEGYWTEQDYIQRKSGQVRDACKVLNRGRIFGEGYMQKELKISPQAFLRVETIQKTMNQKHRLH